MDDHKRIIWTIPNALTLLRFILIGVAYFFGKAEEWGWVLLTTIVAAVTDFFDGDLARKMNCKSVYGAAMDPIADKTFVVVLLILINPQLAITIAIVEVIGMLFSNAVRKNAGGHFIAHGSKGITFLQMTVVVIIIINKINLIVLFFFFFFLKLEIVFDFLLLLRQEELGLLWMILGLTIARLLSYSSLYVSACSKEKSIKKE